MAAAIAQYEADTIVPFQPQVTNANTTAVPNSTNGYHGEIGRRQVRHRPRITHDPIGTFSHQLSWRRHVGQNERGAATERPRGVR